MALGSAGAWYLQTYGITLGEDVVALRASSIQPVCAMRARRQ